MKFTAAIAALILAAAVSATAILNPLPEPHRHTSCHGYVGEACRKAKRAPVPGLEVGEKVQRAAEAFTEALAAADDTTQDSGLQARCDMGACYEAKLMTRELATIVAETTPDPSAFFYPLALEDGETTEKLKRDAEARRDLTSPEADPEARAHYRQNANEPYRKLKRAAKPSASCGGSVGECGKAKRDALALARAAELVLEYL